MTVFIATFISPEDFEFKDVKEKTNLWVSYLELISKDKKSV